MEKILRAIDMLDNNQEEAIKILKANRKDLSEHCGQQKRQPSGW
jgi:hypothetical protein